jgi:SAM-dependent methyltransferase
MDRETPSGASEKPTFSHLDIGGGPDIHPDSLERQSDVSPDELSFERQQLLNLRATQLAQQHPSGNYMVYDPNLIMEVADEVTAEIPNLSFEKGQVDADNPLPFSDNSLDVVEVNHLFYPLINARYLEPKQREVARKRKEFESEFLATPQQVERKLKPIQKAFDSYIATKPQELQNTGSAEELADYLVIVREAARVLRPGGELLLAEAWDRMQAVVRLLSQPGSLQCDGEIMQEMDLEYVSLTDNDDPHRSAYATSRAGMREERREAGQKEDAERFRPMVLRLKKRTV